MHGVIRPYDSRDLGAVLRVWENASAVGHPFLSDDFLAVERARIEHEHLLHAETWVWEAEGRVAGFIALAGNEVGGLFVDADLHGCGIGRALVEHAYGLRRELEVEVFERNTRGGAFYRACGFRELAKDVHAETGLVVVRLRRGPVSTV
jgi:putative acetyltransferase